MAAIELDRLTKVYADGTRAVHELSLEIADGEFVVFVGPSGCGKTSALRMIAGLEEITGGTVRVGDEVVNDLPPKARDMAMIFQNYALYPHMNVYDNMGFGLKMRGIDRGEIRRRVEAAARILGLSEVLSKRPRHLSGGQRQRVAMGRAIVREPQAFLMDEPLSNLDAKLRVQMRAEIARIQRDLRVTTIYVTHDQSEAMTLGDRVCVMRGGLLQQVDRPQVLYDRPANLFVAGFIGSPAMNLVEAELVERDGALSVCFGPHELPVPDRVDLRGSAGQAGRARHPPGGHQQRRGRRSARGHHRHQGGHGRGGVPSLRRRCAARDRRRAPRDRRRRGARSRRRADAPPRQPVRRPRRARAQVREGEKARLAVDTSRLHFFDLASGESLASAADRALVVS